jgi:hypothetical protein
MSSRRESFHRWHTFTTYDLAATVANLMERMTGDPCQVESHGFAIYYVLRDIGNGKLVKV